MTPFDAGSEPVYYVVEMTVPFTSLAEAQAKAAEPLAEHVRLTTDLHRAGEVLMAGAFLEPDAQDGYLRTMAVCRSREAADRFVAGDPFVRNGTVVDHRVRAWANLFAGPRPAS